MDQIRESGPDLDQIRGDYRGTSPIRNISPVGTYSRPMPRDRDPRGLGVSYERGNPVVGASHERGNPVSHHHDVSVVAFVDHVSPPVQPLLEADHVLA